MLNPIAIPKTINDICEDREAARIMIEQAHDLLKCAKGRMEKVSHYLWPYDADPPNSAAVTMEEVDRRLWRHAFDKTGLMQYMDAQARKEFERSLDKEPPAFTEKNCRSVLLSTAQDADTMFVRGLVNVFLRMSKSHKTNTNEPFKVNRKAIMGYWVSNWYGLSVNHSCSDELNDVDRIIKTLDGKEHHPRELETAINGVLKTDENLYEDDYYKIRCFKKGTMHIEFKRQDLLDKANRLIADYYEGQALAGTY